LEDANLDTIARVMTTQLVFLVWKEILASGAWNKELALMLMQLAQITDPATTPRLVVRVNSTGTVPLANRRIIVNGAIILVLARLEGQTALVAKLLSGIHAIPTAEQTENQAVRHVQI